MQITFPNYNHSIVNVTNSILHYFHAPTHHSTLTKLDTILQKNKPNHIIYVLLDGLGVNAINYHLDKTSAIRSHLISDISSVFPPTTVAATTAVLTGQTPFETGHIGWVQYFPKEDTNLIVFHNKDFYTNTSFKENLQEKYLHLDRIYTQLQNANPTLLTKEFFPSFRKGGSESFEEEVERVLLSTHNTDKSFNYVYWVEPDLTEHIKGVYSKEVGTLLKQLDKTFSNLIHNIPNKTTVILVADHGLVDIETIDLFSYKELTDLLRQKPSVEPRATSFFVTPGKEKIFQETFTKLFGNHFKLYTKKDFLTSELLGSGTIHPTLSTSLGDFISVATDKYMFALNKEKIYKAHHAGLTNEEMLVPLVVYSKN
jgi:predicted AlkP superfamily pyrophosphatase or phosphodiesterase